MERCWQLWADPRPLERWWGPPSYPATFVDHDLTPGGFATYFMTGPDGEQPDGWWRIIAVEARAPSSWRTASATSRATPAACRDADAVHLAERPGGGTRMTIESTFPSRVAMEQLISMGMKQGMQEALSQIEAVLAGT